MSRIGQAVTTREDVPGAAEHSLNAAFRRYAVAVRVLVVLACAALGLLGAPDRHWPAVLVAVVTSGWCALSAWWEWGPRGDPHPALRVGAAITALLVVELTQPWTAVGPYNGWAYSVASITCVCTQLELPRRPRLALLVAAVASGAYVAGAAMTRTPADAALFGARLLLETTLARIAYLLIRTRARSADRTHARAAAQRRATAVAAARRSAERDYLAALHDTASATLLMVSLGAAADRQNWLPGRARRDLEVITTAPGPLVGGSLPENPRGDDPPGAPAASTPGTVDLAVLLEQAAEHPLVTVKRDVPESLPVAARPALAISHGVREAVENVARHAGVTEARLQARLDGGGVEVTLTDDGAGFDPDASRAHRRGLTESIVARMAAAGGSATVESAPGAGTTVRWCRHG